MALNLGSIKKSWPVFAVTFVAIVLGVVFDFIERSEKFLLWLHGAMLEAECESACSTAAHLSVGGKWTVGLLSIGLVAFVAWVAQELYNRFQSGVLLERAVLKKYAREALVLFKHQQRNGVQFQDSDVEFSVHINKDFTYDSTLERTITAVSEPVELVGWVTGGDPPDGTLVPVTNFSAEVVAGDKKLLTVPCQFGKHKVAKFVLVIYPSLKPGEPPIRLRLKARWPQSARALARIEQADTTTFQIHPLVASPVNRVKVSLSVDVPGTLKFDRDYNIGQMKGDPQWDCDNRSCSLTAESVTRDARLSVEVTRVTLGS